MILFYGEGRLGNQIFQYQALSTLAEPNERIFSVGLEDLQRSFDLRGPRLAVLMRNGLFKRAIKYVLIPLVMRPLARTLRLFNYASETRYGVPPNDGPGGEFFVRAGLLRGITFVDGGFYQNASFWPSRFPADSFQLKPTLREAAKKYLASIEPPPSRPVFVHVRRGDYLTHADYGIDGFSLPASFYRAAIGELAERASSFRLVFVTDDPGWVEQEFGDITDKVVVSSRADIDFAIMTECAGGILSNSTFSLAAALMLDDPEIMIAPMFWIGFRVFRWLPPRIQVVDDRLLYRAAFPEPTAAG